MSKQDVLTKAAELLERDGAAALSTRSVGAAAGVRPASLYELFGDKDGLLAALAVHAFDLYLAEKQALAHTEDPVADMRRGWDAHVDFGLRHPAFYLLMYGPDRPGRRPPAAARAHDLLLGFLDRTAAAGRLRVPPPLAAGLTLAAVTGVTLTLIGLPAEQRDPEISARLREMLIASLTTEPAVAAADPGLAARALALDAALQTALDAGPDRGPDTARAGASGTPVPLRPTEAALLRDWLQQLAR